VIAFKFLRAGRRGRFSDTAWPLPEGGRAAGWVEAGGPLELCANGVHACSSRHLAYWFDDELWRLELDGEVSEQPTLLLAGRGRLLERVPGWPEAAAAFAVECAEQTAQLAGLRPQDGRLGELAEEAQWHAERAAETRQAVLAAYTAAVAADVHRPGGFDEERVRQSESLAGRLGLG
jgi:hypothetical protein